MDHELGKLLTEIQAKDTNYFIIVTGDHGIAFDPLRHRDQHYGFDLSSTVLHVPLIVYSPKLTQRRVENVASGVDIAPTILNLARLPAPATFEGYSLVAAMLGRPAQLPSTRFSQLFISEDILRGRDPLRMVGARTNRYSMIVDRRSGLVHAWALQNDPDERFDLWQAHTRANDSRGQALRSLKAQLDAFTRESLTRHLSPPVSD